MLKLTDDEKKALRARCSRSLLFDRPRSAADWVAAMAASPHLELGLDAYSRGPAIERLELVDSRIAVRDETLMNSPHPDGLDMRMPCSRMKPR